MALIGVPYQWGGDEPADGFDCSGPVKHVYREALGIRLPRTSRLISERGRQVARRGLREGGLVFFNTSRRAWSHVGIYVGDDRFVHAPSTGSLVRVDSLNQRYWNSRYDGARRCSPDQDAPMRLKPEGTADARHRHLPLADAEPPAAGGAGARRQPRILLLDDDQFMLGMQAGCLAAWATT